MSNDTVGTGSPLASGIDSLTIPTLVEGKMLVSIGLEADPILPTEVHQALMAYQVLRSSEPWQELPGVLSECMPLFATGVPPGDERFISPPSEVAELAEAFRVLQRYASNQQRQAERAEDHIRKAGFERNRDNGYLETRTRRRPRSVLRDLIRILVRHLGATENSETLREEIRDYLVQYTFLPASDLQDISKDSRFYKAVKDEVRALRDDAKRGP